MTLYKKWDFPENSKIIIIDENPPLPWYIHNVINKFSEWQLKIDSSNNIDEILTLHGIPFSSEYSFFEDTILYTFTNSYDLNIAKLLI